MGKRYDQPLGYIILESENLDLPLENVEVVKTENLFYLKFIATVQSLNTVNRNKRLYEDKALIAGLNEKNFKEKLRRGKLYGELGHPYTNDIGRVTEIVEANASHKIIKWWREKDLIKALIYTAANERYGKLLTQHILQGDQSAYSLRALGDMVKEKNILRINKPPIVITYDEVNFPSHPEAYMDIDDAKEIKSYISDSKVKTFESKILDIMPEDISKYISESSTNVAMVCESFGISPERMKMLENGMISISESDKSNKFVVPLEAELKRDYMDYMSSIL